MTCRSVLQIYNCLFTNTTVSSAVTFLSYLHLPDKQLKSLSLVLGNYVYSRKFYFFLDEGFGFL